MPTADGTNLHVGTAGAIIAPGVSIRYPSMGAN